MGNLKVLENVEILVVDGRIASIDPTGTHPIPDETIDAKGSVVLPGLVDPHRHFGAACIPDGGCARGASAPRDPAPEERHLLRSARRALVGGTTTVGVKCGADPSSADEVDLLAVVRAIGETTPLRVSAALLGTPRGTERAGRDDRISEMIGQAIPAVRRRRLARCCDVTCGDGGYLPAQAEALLRAARGAGLSLGIHAMAGELDAAAILAATLGATSIAHLRDCGGRAASSLRESGVVSVVLPGVPFFCGGEYPNARRMIDADLAVALGTDYSVEGFGVESVWASLGIAIERMDVSLEEAITSITLNAAAALDIADTVGSVEVGKAADLAILDLEDYRQIAGRLGCEPVAMTLVDGHSVMPS